MSSSAGDDGDVDMRTSLLFGSHPGLGASKRRFTCRCYDPSLIGCLIKATGEKKCEKPFFMYRQLGSSVWREKRKEGKIETIKVMPLLPQLLICSKKSLTAFYFVLIFQSTITDKKCCLSKCEFSFKSGLSCWTIQNFFLSLNASFP